MTTVSTSGFYDSAMFNMSNLQTQVDKLQTEISTGNQFSSAAQNPVAAAQMRALQLQDALSTADTQNANTAKASLGLADSTLSQVTSTIEQIQTLAEQAASATLTDTQRASIGTQVAGLYTNLVSLANTQDTNGNPLFGGNASGPAYTLDASGNATYAGAANANTVSLGAGLSVTTGVTGPQVFDYTVGGTPTNLLSAVQSLAAGLQGNTSGTTPQAAAQTALGQLSAGLTQATTAQTLIGARENWVTTTTTVQSQLATQRSTEESNLGSTDISTAVSQLQQTMTTLEAAQASFVKVSGMTLFSMIQG